MTLKEYLEGDYEDGTKVKGRIAVMMLDHRGKVMLPMEYNCKDFKCISKEVLDREYMESNQEDDLMEVWVM